jgi:hypothetical protein
MKTSEFEHKILKRTFTGLIDSSLNESFFSMCPIDAIKNLSAGDQLWVTISFSNRHKTLSAAHCVDFSDMDDEMLVELAYCINDILTAVTLSHKSKIKAWIMIKMWSKK